VRLVPGDPFSALARVANQLSNTHLLIIGADHESSSMDRAWRYIPRMLTPTTVVLEAPLDHATAPFVRLTTADIYARAAAAEKSQRIAA
jgi:hypothetical protein